jgi:MFS superfamily sulfate permease-like transporter
MKKRIDYLSAVRNDIPSSIVVFLVALPLCLGIAMGSQAPLFSGIIAGIIGGIAVGIMSGSHLSVSGPAAGLTTIVAAAIGKLQVYEAFLLAVFLSGCFQLLFGFLKAGVIGDYVPGSVIKGMLSAIGIILILKQFPHLIGYDKDFEGDIGFQQADRENTLSEIIHSFQFITPAALIIGTLGLAFQTFWESFIAGKKGMIKLIPSPLVVVLIGIGINEFFKANFPAYAIGSEHMVAIPVAGSVNDFLSFFHFPDWTYITNPDIWVTALTIALVASLETLLSIEAVDELDPYKRVTPTNRELMAQGTGNMLSGLIGGLPMTSVIVRSSANVNAGAKTKMSAVYHGALLLLSVAFLPSLLNMIPKSALAAVLIFTGYKLAKPSLIRAIYKKGLDQFIPFVITILAILFSDLLTGVLIGIGTGLLFVLKSNFHSTVFLTTDDNKYLFRLRKDISFLNKPIIKRKLEEVPENALVLIDLSKADFIDKDVVEVIEDFAKHAHLKGIRVELKLGALSNPGFNLPAAEKDNGGYIPLGPAIS